MYKTVLVPLDGSRRAEAILPHVEEIALSCDAEVVFVRVVEPVSYVVGSEGTPVQLHEQDLKQRTKQAASYLSALEGEFREKGISARATVRHGPVVEAIIRAAKREEADLIAMASHGRSGLGQVFYGSVAAGVLHRVDRPLLIVRSLGRK